MIFFNIVLLSETVGAFFMCIIGDAGLPRQNFVLVEQAPLKRNVVFGKEV